MQTLFPETKPQLPEELRLECLSKGREKEAAGDVIFVHGMGGDLYDTWSGNEETFHWGTWLAEERHDLCVWTLGYPAAPSLWAGNAMPLQDRAKSVLALLKADGFGKRPVCFIVHSLGGLLVKQMLHKANTGGVDSHKKMMRAVRGVVYLSTPHIGSNIATIISHVSKLVRATEVIDDLRVNAALLRDLNEWYINHTDKLKIKNLVFFEKQNTKGVRIVDEASGGIAIKGAEIVPVDADHFEICKPRTKNAAVYKSTRSFLDEVLHP